MRLKNARKRRIGQNGGLEELDELWERDGKEWHFITITDTKRCSTTGKLISKKNPQITVL